MFTSQNKKDLPSLIAKQITGKKVAIKVHFGRSQKSASFLDPRFYYCQIKKDVDFIDSNTLYSGERGNSKDHLKLAMRHGFKNAKILSEDVEFVDENIAVSKDLYKYDQIIEIAHFSGHKIVGYGGCIKNIAMGLGAKKTKLWIHNGGAPAIDFKKCSQCGWCRQNCLYLKNKKGTCSGCGACIGYCKASGFSFGKSKNVAIRLVETSYKITKHLHQKGIVFSHVCIGEDPDRLCDCMGNKNEVMQKGFLAVCRDDPAQADYEMIKHFRNIFNYYKKDLIVGQIGLYRKLTDKKPA